MSSMKKLVGLSCLRPIRSSSPFTVVQRTKITGPEPSYSKAAGYNLASIKGDFKTTWNETLVDINVAYETWGSLNEERSNAILLMTGLSASSHACSTEKNPARGWWEDFIGLGRPLDTSKYYIICCNNLGSCFGSTGPSSINPLNQKRYALTFPFVSVQDIVRSQFLCLDSLRIDKLHAVVGSSLGGMLSLAAASMFPDRVARLVSISAAAESHPMSIAIRFAQRKALMSDPNFNSGNYYDSTFPSAGLQLSREIATFTYRSGPEWVQRFGRKRRLEGVVTDHDTELEAPESQKPSMNAEFEVEKYLEYQAMDLFTIAKQDSKGILSLDEGKTDKVRASLGFAPIKMPTLIMGVDSDILFPIEQQHNIATRLQATGNSYVVFYELNSIYGHDTFLIDVNAVGAAVKGHLEQLP